MNFFFYLIIPELRNVEQTANLRHLCSVLVLTVNVDLNIRKPQSIRHKIPLSFSEKARASMKSGGPLRNARPTRRIVCILQQIRKENISISFSFFGMKVFVRTREVTCDELGGLRLGQRKGKHSHPHYTCVMGTPSFLLPQTPPSVSLPRHALHLVE